jgi:hypothetical protein
MSGRDPDTQRSTSLHILDLLLELLLQRDREYLIRMVVVVQLWKHDPAIVVPRLIATVRGDGHDLVRASAADSLELLDEVSPFDPSRHDVWVAPRRGW